MKLDKPLNLDFSEDSERLEQTKSSQKKLYGTDSERHALLKREWTDLICKRSKLTELADKYGSDKGFRKHLYTTVYEEFIKPGKVKSLLEIGLLCHDDQREIGGEEFSLAPSLDMWAEYLPEAEIYGFDIQDFSGAGGGWKEILQGDQSSRNDLAKIGKLNVKFDVIIDDALHASMHQQVTFSALFPMLKPGGLYIIEDLHYQPFKEPSDVKTIVLMKTLSEKMKWESQYTKTEERKYIESSIAEVLFFDSMKLSRTSSKDALCIVRKK